MTSAIPWALTNPATLAIPRTLVILGTLLAIFGTLAIPGILAIPGTLVFRMLLSVILSLPPSPSPPYDNLGTVRTISDFTREGTWSCHSAVCFSVSHFVVSTYKGLCRLCFMSHFCLRKKTKVGEETDTVVFFL